MIRKEKDEKRLTTKLSFRLKHMYWIFFLQIGPRSETTNERTKNDCNKIQDLFCNANIEQVERQEYAGRSELTLTMQNRPRLHLQR